MFGRKTQSWVVGAAVAVLAGGTAAGAAERVAACGAAGSAGFSVPVAAAPVDLSLERGADGRVVLRAVVGGLEVRKAVADDGAFDLTLSVAGDAVAVSGSLEALSVARGGERLAIQPGRRDAPAAAAVARLLAGSPAILAFRAALASSEDGWRQTPGGLGLLMADVILRVLQDDPSAILRLRPAPSSAGVVWAAAPMPRPCFAEWEAEVIAAWDWYENCFDNTSWWSGGSQACAVIYFIRVEAAWFQFLKCVGFSIQ